MADLEDALRELDYRSGEDEPAPVTPEPLTRPVTPGQPYPVDAFPPLMAEAAMGIVDKIDVPPAIAAQSVLAVCALTAQTFYDVVLPIGHPVPLSLDLISILETGGRKSAADKEATRAVADREKSLRERYEFDKDAFDRDEEAYKAARSDVIRDKSTNGNRAAKAAAIAKLGPAPLPPLFPSLTATEPTVEGLLKVMPNGQPSLGVMSSEGGALLGGFGFSEDHLLKTSAVFSSLWDGEVLKRVRAGGENVILVGRRVSLHLQIQPGVAERLFGSDVCRDQGLLSRILAVAPESNIGSRRSHDLKPESQEAIDRFNERIGNRLAGSWPLIEGRRNELAPRRLPLDAATAARWREYADDVENRLGPGGALEPVRGLANKLPEHATRIAAVLTAICENHPLAVSLDYLERGIRLAEHYAIEAIRIYEAGKMGGDLALARMISDWLHKTWPHAVVSLPDLYQRGPCMAIRDKTAATKIAAILEDHGHLVKRKSGATIDGNKRRVAWQITGKAAL